MTCSFNNTCSQLNMWDYKTEALLRLVCQCCSEVTVFGMKVILYSKSAMTCKMKDNISLHQSTHTRHFVLCVRSAKKQYAIFIINIFYYNFCAFILVQELKLTIFI